MQAAEVMLWEFDVRTRLFYAENEPLNGYDPTQALTIEDYKKQIHPEDWKKRRLSYWICSVVAIVCMK